MGLSQLKTATSPRGKIQLIASTMMLELHSTSIPCLCLQPTNQCLRTWSTWCICTSHTCLAQRHLADATTKNSTPKLNELHSFHYKVTAFLHYTNGVCYEPLGELGLCYETPWLRHSTRVTGLAFFYLISKDHSLQNE